MTAACDACLRRAHLIAWLAPGITRALLKEGERRPGLFASSDEELIHLLAGERRNDAERFMKTFDAAAARLCARRARLGAVCRHDERYPEGVRELPDVPAVLFHTGPLERLSGLAAAPVVTIVGARRASSTGVEVALELARGAARAGGTVVSGMALGIDGAAHRGALEGGGATIAVLAGGADWPYPQRHRRLYERIAESGSVISELPPGTRPYRWSFPARNRIMAALAKVVVIVEATSSSGTRITADFATDLGRQLAAVPGRVNASLAGLPNGLLKDGAALIRGVEDLLDELLGNGKRPPGWDPSGRAQAIGELEPFERAVLFAVQEGLSVAAIATAGDIPARRVRATLARLELLDLVRANGAGGYEARSVA